MREIGNRERLALWKRTLPYGKWICADGREVLFNREYTPILQRRPNGPTEVASPTEWVPWVKQVWFYQEGKGHKWLKTGPSKQLLNRVNRAILDWGVYYKKASA